MTAMTAKHDEQREFWEQNTDSYELFLKLFGGPMSEVRNLLRERVDEGHDVLEVAAGTGKLSTVLAPRAGWFVATDYAEAMVSVLEERLETFESRDVACRQANIEELPFEDGTFDVVVAGNVLHILPDLSRGVGEIRRVLRSGGTLIAPTFIHDETRVGWFLSRLLAMAGGPQNRHFDAASFREALENEGLDVRDSQVVSGLLPMAYVECESA